VRQLAGPVDRRFDGVAVRRPTRHAVTLDDGLARFDCTIYREAEAGDHLIVLLNLHAVDHPQSGSPLDFNDSGFSRLAETA
jgi:flavin reductase (DIM6/NTAB) family NADH-FMN oxidoreductase RutF